MKKIIIFVGIFLFLFYSKQVKAEDYNIARMTEGEAVGSGILKGITDYLNEETRKRNLREELKIRKEVETEKATQEEDYSQSYIKKEWSVATIPATNNSFFYSELIALLPDREHSSDDKSLADALVTVFIHFGKKVIERTNIDKILGEQKLSLTGILEKSDYKKLGKISNVDFIVFCSVGSSTEKYYGKRFDSVNNINVKMIEIETGEVVLSIQAEKPSNFTFSDIANEIGWSIRKQFDLYDINLWENYPGMVGIRTIKNTERKTIIQNILKDSPAEKSGLLKGDEIIAIDNINIENCSQTEITRLCRGKIDSIAKLTIKRNNITMDFNVSRMKDKDLEDNYKWVIEEREKREFYKSEVKDRITEDFSGKTGISVYRSYWFRDSSPEDDIIWGGSLKYSGNGVTFLGLDVLIYNNQIKRGLYEGGNYVEYSGKISVIPILLTLQRNITQNTSVIPYIKFGLGPVIIKEIQSAILDNGHRFSKEIFEVKFGLEISGGTEIFVAPQYFPISINIDISYLNINQFIPYASSGGLWRTEVSDELRGVKFDGGINVYF
ncbi:MAG: PDZ domain-containing protein [Candidatus Firestonebacteria bacterium]